MTDDDYAAPPPPSSLYFSPTKHIGALVLMTPTHEAVEDKPWGRVNAVYASVFVLQGEGAGMEFDSVGIGNAQLASQLRQRLGSKVLARLAPQGRSVVIASPSEEDKATARRWEQNNPGKAEKAMKREAAFTEQGEPLRQPTREQVAAQYAGGLPTPPPVTRSYSDEPPF